MSYNNPFLLFPAICDLTFIIQLLISNNVTSFYVFWQSYLCPYLKDNENDPQKIMKAMQTFNRYGLLSHCATATGTILDSTTVLCQQLLDRYLGGMLAEYYAVFRG